VLFGTGGDIWERDVELARTVMESLGGDFERSVPTDSAFSGVCGVAFITRTGGRLPIGNEVEDAEAAGGTDTGIGLGDLTTFCGVIFRVTLFTCCSTGLAEFPFTTGATTGGTGDLDTTRLTLEMGRGCGGEVATGSELFVAVPCCFPTLSLIFGPAEAGGSAGFCGD